MKAKNLLADALFTILGGIIWSVGINVFTVPNKIAPGGATGISTVINHFTKIPVGTLIILINIPLFIIAFFLIGKNFTLKSAAAIVITSIILDVTATYLPSFTEDKLLSAVFGGILSGFGLGIIYIRGIATGGSDLLARLIDIKVSFLTYGQTIFIIDVFVILFAAISYNDIFSGLYSAVTVFISTTVSDRLLSGNTKGKAVYIISKNPEKISSAVIKYMKRGATEIFAKGCFSKENRNILMIAVKNYELPALKKIIKSADENAFVIISSASEISGNGFPLQSLTNKDKKGT